MRKRKLNPRVFNFAMTLALVLIASLGLSVDAGVTLANHTGDPPGCSSNEFYVDISRIPNVVHIGENITYTVCAGNGTPGPPVACNVTNATITLRLPASDGTATGTLITLATGANFTWDGSDDTCYPNVTWTVDVNPGVSVIYAKAKGKGQVQFFIPVTAAVKKNVPTSILSPEIEVTKEADAEFSKAGDNITYTITVNNTGHPSC